MPAKLCFPGLVHLSQSLYPAWFVLLAITLACGDPSSPAAGIATAGENPPAAARKGPPGARWETVDMLREARDLRFDPSDGGGRAWLEQAEPAKPSVSSPGRFTIVYEAGPHGIADGGMIFLQVSLFWGWSTPQTFSPEMPGYTEVTSQAEGVTLEAGTLDQQLLGIQVGGRPLEAGEKVRIVYGAGSVGAITDSFAEKRERLWIAVDGDGDGVAQRCIADSPARGHAWLVSRRRGFTSSCRPQCWAARARSLRLTASRCSTSWAMPRGVLCRRHSV